MSKHDLEIPFRLLQNGFKEEKNKVLSAADKSDLVTAYVFKDKQEMENYFKTNGVIDPNNLEVLIKICSIKETKKGSIISLKSLCDYSITQYVQKHSEINNNNKIIK